MAYADFIVRFGNHSEDEYKGLDFDTEKLDRDLNVLFPTVNELNRIVRGITTADGDLSPASPDRENDIVDTQTLSGDGSTVAFSLINPIDANVTLIGNVMVDGVLMFEGTDYLYSNTDLTFTAAPSNGIDNISYQTFMNMAGVIDSLKSVTYQNGAYQVGYPDALALYNATTVGDALDEIRQLHDAHELEFGAASQYLKADGSVNLTFDWCVNERKDTGTATPAIGSVTIISTVLETTTVTIPDGIVPGGETFEFIVSPTVPTPGNIGVEIGGSDDETIDNLIAAIGLSALNISAVNAGGGVANLTHQISSALGNLPLSTSDAGIFTVVGMLNGVNGILGDLCNSFRIRCLPPSLEDGDVVVHEQLQGLLNVIENFSDLFFRLDGTSTMAGDANMGGNQVKNIADGTEDTDAVSLQQLTAVQDIFNLFIPVAGAADTTYAAQSVITGALSMGQAATDDADNVQDSGSVVHTWHGIARPSEDDHVANRLFVEEVEAGLQAQINAIDVGSGQGGNQPDGSPSVGSDIAGCVLDGTGLGSPVPDLNSGGIYNFENLTVVAAQTPAEDTFIFSDGDVNINSNITCDGQKVEISASGNVTLDAAATINCFQILIRAGGIITLNGDIVADGDVNRGLGVQTNGIVGYATFIAGGAFVQDAASSVTSAFINVQAGASSTMAGTLTGTITNSGGREANGASVAQHGGQVGQHCGLALNPYNNNSHSIATLTYIGASYAGGEGRAIQSFINDGAGGGGAGGTAGGDGGNGDTGSGGNSRLRGTYRPYLYPMHPGGGGAGGTYVITGAGHRGGNAGGAIVVYVVGDLVATGALFQVGGSNADSSPGSNGEAGAGGGGGGACRIVATGTITDGTISADGGNATTDNGDGGGGGGGGCAFFIASAYLGVPTTDVSGGGNAGSGGQVGQSGTESVITMPDTDILCLAAQGYWSN